MEKAFCIVLCNSRGTKTHPKSSPRSAKELPRTPQSRPRAETLHAEPLYIDNKPKRHANLWRLFNTSDSFRYEEHRLGNHTQLQPSGRTPQHMEVHPSNISATNAIKERGSHASSLLPTMNATAVPVGLRASMSSTSRAVCDERRRVAKQRRLRWN